MEATTSGIQQSSCLCRGELSPQERRKPSAPKRGQTLWASMMVHAQSIVRKR